MRQEKGNGGLRMGWLRSLAVSLVTVALAGCASAPEKPVATFVVFTPDPARLPTYDALRTPAVDLTFRPASPDPADLAPFEAAKAPFFFTAASSDFPNYLQRPLYVPAATLDAVAARPLCRGFYVHEVLTVESGRRKWDWNTALKAFDWAWMDALVELARSRGLKVLWSEPSYAWQTVEATPDATAHLARWGDTVVLLFATNFPDQIEFSRRHAVNLSQRFRCGLGQSHQAWRFHDAGCPVLGDGSFLLARDDGWAHGARWFQFEGKPSDLDARSPYMQGVARFARSLESR